MITISIVIFLISTFLAFGMLLFRAWELRTSRIIDNEKPKYTPELSFRYFEKIILYIAKHIIQWIVLSSVKIWFTMITKIKVWFQNKLPKINRYFQKKTNTDSRKISFVERAVMESKIKIKKVKEKIQKEHEEDLKEAEEEVDKII